MTPTAIPAAERLAELRRRRQQLAEEHEQANERITSLRRRSEGLNLDDLFKFDAKKTAEAAPEVKPKKDPWWKRLGAAIKGLLPTRQAKAAPVVAAEKAPVVAEAAAIEKAPEEVPEGARPATAAEVQALRDEIVEAMSRLASIEEQIRVLDEQIAALEKEVALGAAPVPQTTAAPQTTADDPATVQATGEAMVAVGKAAVAGAGQGEDKLRAALETCGTVQEVFCSIINPGEPLAFSTRQQPGDNTQPKLFLVTTEQGQFAVPTDLARPVVKRRELVTSDNWAFCSPDMEDLVDTAQIAKFIPAKLGANGEGGWRIDVQGSVSAGTPVASATVESAPAAAPAPATTAKGDDALRRLQEAATATHNVGKAAVAVAGQGEDKLRDALEGCGTVREAFYDATVPVTRQFSSFKYTGQIEPGFTKPRKVFVVTDATQSYLVPACLANPAIRRGDVVTGNEGKPRSKNEVTFKASELAQFRPAILGGTATEGWSITVPGGVVHSAPDLAEKAVAAPKAVAVAQSSAAAVEKPAPISPVELPAPLARINAAVLAGAGQGQENLGAALATCGTVRRVFYDAKELPTFVAEALPDFADTQSAFLVTVDQHDYLVPVKLADPQLRMKDLSLAGWLDIGAAERNPVCESGKVTKFVAPTVASTGDGSWKVVQRGLTTHGIAADTTLMDAPVCGVLAETTREESHRMADYISAKKGEEPMRVTNPAIMERMTALGGHQFSEDGFLQAVKNPDVPNDWVETKMGLAQAPEVEPAPLPAYLRDDEPVMENSEVQTMGAP